MSVSRPCDECSKVRRCAFYQHGAWINYLCRPCARKLGYRDPADTKGPTPTLLRHRAVGAAALLMLGLLAGCSSSGSLWRHSATGEESICATRGWGWLGAPAAAMEYGRCKDRLEERGFRKVRVLSTDEIVGATGGYGTPTRADENAAGPSGTGTRR